MTDKFFNLENPIEKAVYERLKKYALSGKDYDTVIGMIGRDFPNLDSGLRDACHATAFRHYFTDNGKKGVGMVKQVEILHSNSIDDQFYSHVNRIFHLRDGEDIMAAIMVENPLYLYENAEIHLSIYVAGVKTNEFQHTMDLSERSNVYYVPLKIRQAIKEDTDLTEPIQVFIMNEKIQGDFYGEVFMVTLGEYGAEDAFNDVEIELVERENSLEMYASLNYDRQLGYRFEVEGTVVFSPCDTEDRMFSLIRPIRLEYSNPDDDLMHGYCTIFKVWRTVIEDEIPHYEPKAGRYSVKLYIWNTLMWSGEINLSSAEVPAPGR